jgi:hypothetical protein
MAEAHLLIFLSRERGDLTSVLHELDFFQHII